MTAPTDKQAELLQLTAEEEDLLRQAEQAWAKNKERDSSSTWERVDDEFANGPAPMCM